MTCDKHEKQAISEAYNIIECLMEDTQSEPSRRQTDTGDHESEDVADSLKRICAEFRDGKTKARRCVQKPTGVKNCIFVTVRDADVVDLAKRMVDYAQSSRQCRYLQRVLPVEETCGINLNEINDLITKCVSRHLRAKNDGSTPSYALEYRARNNDTIKRVNILEMLGVAVNSIAPKAKVDLNGADVTIMVNVLRKTVMVGGIPNFYAKHKYIMRPKEFSDTVVDRKPPVLENVEEKYVDEEKKQ
ncbi:THUMP domain protein [Dictyocaulus viviparus]|uniref:THUMP domain protein n=1 Tax=Dictyocaulus viviparus TaxID=29172 RepID=A0A0D8YCM5_DICVI|nr:THUMP domain protein [Dictyocaulus viviparus]